MLHHPVCARMCCVCAGVAALMAAVCEAVLFLFSCRDECVCVCRFDCCRWSCSVWRGVWGGDATQRRRAMRRGAAEKARQRQRRKEQSGTQPAEQTGSNSRTDAHIPTAERRSDHTREEREKREGKGSMQSACSFCAG
jgi:hypothetical protein